MWSLNLKRTVGGLGFCLAVSSAVQAAELTANVGITSNYVFRGNTQSDDGFAVQGGVDYHPANGFFAGLWASTIDCPTGVTPGCTDSATNSATGLEIDLYAGYSFKLKDGWGIDLGFITYEYTDSDKDANREFFIGVNYKGFSLNYYKGDDTTAGDPDYTYLDLKVKVELPDKVFFHGHFGRLDPERGSSTNDVSIGVSKILWDLDFMLMLTAEDRHDKEEFFVTVTKKFDLR